MNFDLQKLFTDKAAHKTPEQRLFKALATLSLAAHSMEKKTKINRLSDQTFKEVCCKAFQFEPVPRMTFSPYDTVIRIFQYTYYNKPEKFDAYIHDERTQGSEEGQNLDRIMERIPQFEADVKAFCKQNPPRLIDRAIAALRSIK